MSYFSLNEHGQELLKQGIDKLLNVSLSETSQRVLPITFSSTTDIITGPIVLELASLITNVSESKESGLSVSPAAVSSTSLLRCTLWDGHTRYLAVITSPVKKLHLNSLPGLKVQCQNVPVISKCFILNSDNTQVLGGSSQEMSEKHVGVDREAMFKQKSMLDSLGDPKRPKFDDLLSSNQISDGKKPTQHRKQVATQVKQETPTTSSTTLATVPSQKQNNSRPQTARKQHNNPSQHSKTESRPATRQEHKHVAKKIGESNTTVSRAPQTVKPTVAAQVQDVRVEHGSRVEKPVITEKQPVPQVTASQRPRFSAKVPEFVPKNFSPKIEETVDEPAVSSQKRKFIRRS
ncbi:hypothetical protein RCL1_007062 [Eukaryota sp. TZLM3-RCL]